MSNIELLLGLDTETLTMIPEGEVEIPRLSKLVGAPYMVKVTALSGRQIDRLRELAKDKRGNVKDYDLQVLVCAKAMKDPDMNDDDLMKKMGTATPKDTVEKVFNRSGEVRLIATEVLRLSGMIQEDDEPSFEDEVKN